MTDDILYYIWLAQSFPFGSVKPKAIVSSFDGNLKEFYNNLDEAVKKFDLTAKQLQKLKNKKPDDFTYIIKRCNKLKIKIVCFSDENYPQKLKTIDSSPIVLYYIGNLNAANGPSVAIVGTRKASPYGLKAANQIAKSLVAHNITIVSGCAEGIDSSAHLGAVEMSQPTIAVLGTSIEKPYPPGSGALKRKILNLNGLIISEYAPGHEIFRWLFPIRNRLIVGLSDLIIVVESPEKSGAAVTANIANEFGKEVFCVPPSNIFSHNNDGIKKFLKDGANLLLDVSDVLDFYKFSDYVIPKQPVHTSKSNKTEKKVPEKLKPLFDLINSDFDIDYTSSKLNLEVNKILEMLTELEILGLIKKYGMYYRKS